MKPYYPIMLDLNEKPCIVIGGGNVAERKVSSLINANGRVTVISPVVTKELEKLTHNGAITLINREYQKGDLEGAFLIIIATDNPELNLAIYHDVNQKNQLVNIVDMPELCTFIVPANVNRGHLQIAISTRGASPGLAKKIRTELESIYGEEYIEYSSFLAEMRRWIFTQNIDQKERKDFFAKILEEEYFSRVTNGQRKEVEKELKSTFTNVEKIKN